MLRVRNYGQIVNMIKCDPCRRAPPPPLQTVICLPLVGKTLVFPIVRVEKADATIKTFYTNLTPRFGERFGAMNRRMYYLYVGGFYVFVTLRKACRHLGFCGYVLPYVTLNCASAGTGGWGGI